MSIRSKLSRTRRRSASSDETTQTATTAVSSTNSSTTDLTKTSSSSASRLVKTFSWRGTGNRSATSGGGSPKKSRKSNRTEVLHPSERPFTETNLRHQEMLSHFTMTFGRRQSTVSTCSGISPCSSRQCSIDLGVGPTVIC